MTVNVRLCAPTCAFLLFLVYAECHGMRNVTRRLCPRAEVRDLRGKRVPVDGGPKRRSVRRVSSAMPAVRVWEQGIADEPGAGRNKRGNVPWGSTFLQRTNQQCEVTGHRYRWDKSTSRRATEGVSEGEDDDEHREHDDEYDDGGGTRGGRPRAASRSSRMQTVSVVDAGDVGDVGDADLPPAWIPRGPPSRCAVLVYMGR